MHSYLSKLVQFLWPWKKGSPKISDTSAILIKLPKVNNRQIGENWPNLVTLSAVGTPS
jgi:hypothetical protein